MASATAQYNDWKIIRKINGGVWHPAAMAYGMQLKENNDYYVSVMLAINGVEMAGVVTMAIMA